jgi:hypothetical protein
MQRIMAYANQTSSWKTQLLERLAGRTTRKAGAVPGLASKLQRLSIHRAPPVAQEDSDRTAAAVARRVDGERCGRIA